MRVKQFICAITYIVVALFMLNGCKSKTVYVPVESVKTEYRDKIQLDSIYRRDSIYINRYQIGDTIFMEKYIDRFVYKNRAIKDSIFKTDSIQVPYPVIEYKEVNRLNTFQGFQIWCGRILLLLAFIYFGYKGLKYII